MYIETTRKRVDCFLKYGKYRNIIFRLLKIWFYIKANFEGNTEEKCFDLELDYGTT